MPTVFSSQDEYAVRGSTFSFTASYTDEDGNAVTPDTMTWTLKDASGDTINSRSAVDLAPMATYHVITLQGDDLPVPAGDVLAWIYCVLEGTYTSSLGSGLPLRDWLEIPVKDDM